MVTGYLPTRDTYLHVHNFSRFEISKKSEHVLVLFWSCYTPGTSGGGVYRLHAVVTVETSLACASDYALESN